MADARTRRKLEDLLNLNHEVVYGEAEQISPLISRVTAPNPGPFTFKGTGTYLVGHDELAVIDPGPAIGDHVDALLKAARGRRITKILVTHTHADHSPASRPLARATGAEVLGFGPHPAAEHSAAAEVEEGGDFAFRPDRELSHGDVTAGAGWTLECLHTPGHISNHLCFALLEERALFTGDHVMGWSSVVIVPPDGSLGDYLKSLELLKLRAGLDRVYYPAHGPAVASPGELVDALLEHRRGRSQEIVRQLGELDGAGIPELTSRIYEGLQPDLVPAAEMTVWAHLRHLVEQEVVSADGGSLGLESSYRRRASGDDGD